VSGGELERALRAGVPPNRIVFSGVAKSTAEMRLALEKGIFQFNVESEQELERLGEVASETGATANIAFRINPDIDARTHAKISTGRFENKFGISWKRAGEVYARAAEMPGIRVQGIAMHIGSQLTELEPFEQAFGRMAELTSALRGQGHEISVLDIGGGLGIHYDPSAPPPPPLEGYAGLAVSTLGGLGCRIVVEPGRSIAGPAGLLVSEVIYVKQGETERFLIVDAGMNDLLRPSLYDAHHEILAVRSGRAEKKRYDVVGPVCETGDTFCRDRELPRFEPGDLLAIRDAGAYGAVMSFSYNTRPPAPEVLVDGSEFTVIRERESLEELIGKDSVPG
jgi:diaminopimelate decarboxylase